MLRRKEVILEDLRTRRDVKKKRRAKCKTEGKLCTGALMKEKMDSKKILLPEGVSSRKNIL
jgi:hypothetical protein